MLFLGECIFNSLLTSKKEVQEDKGLMSSCSCQSVFGCDLLASPTPGEDLCGNGQPLSPRVTQLRREDCLEQMLKCHLTRRSYREHGIDVKPPKQLFPQSQPLLQLKVAFSENEWGVIWCLVNTDTSISNIWTLQLTFHSTSSYLK